MPNEFQASKRALLMAAVSACYPLAGEAAPAARVDFAIGDVKAVAPTGVQRPLAKGGEIEEGESVLTGSGRAQLRFTDGAQMSLLPQTEFKVEQYRFAGTADGSEKGVFRLLKGGLRTITGLIGRSQRQNYQVATTVATIGIRGTAYSLRYANSIDGTVADGSIEACNAAGCATFGANESFHVESNDSLPQQTFKKMEVSTGDNTQNMTLGGYIQGDVALNASPPLTPLTLLTGPLDNAALAIVHEPFCCLSPIRNYPDGGEGNNFNPTGRFTLNAQGELIDFADGSNGTLTTDNGTMTRVSDGNDGIIAWGRWLNGNPSGTGRTAAEGFQNALHYVAGIPTSVADMDNLRIANVIATYTLIGGTAPTWGGTTGTLNSASLVANFGAGTSLAGVNATVGTNSFIVSGVPLTIGGFIPAQFQSTGSGSSSGSGCPCSTTIQGFFSGANAIRAGFAYQIRPVEDDPVIGAAAFRR